jgi:C-terminal processing protease CtpA/Prc
VQDDSAFQELNEAFNKLKKNYDYVLNEYHKLADRQREYVIREEALVRTFRAFLQQQGLENLKSDVNMSYKKIKAEVYKEKEAEWGKELVRQELGGSGPK